MKKSTKILIAVIAVILVIAIITAIVLVNVNKNSDKGESGDQSNQNVTNSNLSIETSSDMENLINKIYEGLNEVYPNSVVTTNVDITDVNVLTSYTGLTSNEKIDAVVASEPMMSAQAYSLVLVKVKDAKDTDSIAKEMSEKVDRRKWICVSAGQLYSTSSGNLVCLVMASKEQATAVFDKFKTLAGEVGQVYEKVEEEIVLPPDMY